MTKKKKKAKPRAFFVGSVEAELLEWLGREITKYENEVKLQTANLADPRDAFHHLAWSDSLFSAAAHLHVYLETQRALTASDSNADFGSVREYALKQALNKAKFPTRSTSPCSNLMETELLVAWVDLVDRLGWIRPLKLDESS